MKQLFTNVMIFDGSGSDLFAGEVLIDGDKISSVVKGDVKIDRTGAKVYDGGGKTLMPGMVEAHAHLTWPTNIERVVNGMMLPLEEHVMVTVTNARITLDAGFTSAYSAGSVAEKVEPYLRDMINAGHIPGPRLRASSLEKGFHMLTGAVKEDAPMPDEFDSNIKDGFDTLKQRGIKELTSYIKDMKAMGCDSVKILLSNDEAFKPGGSHDLLYSPEEVLAIGETAKEVGVWLACHSQSAESIKLACKAGFRALFHCIHCDEEGLDMMEARKNELFMAPAAGLMYSRCYEAEAFGIDKATAEKMGAFLALEKNAENIPEMRKRGIRVLPGGDYGFPYNEIGRNARDLEIFVNMFGFTPKEALVAATKEGGELCDWPVGQIKPGYFADILLIDGDPTKDVSILQHKNKMPVVMKGGEFHRVPPELLVEH